MNMRSSLFLEILKISLYVIAGLVLVLGLFAGISLIASAANVRNLLMSFQFMGTQAISNLIAPYFTGLMNGLGVFVSVISLVLSLLLFAVGRLLGYFVDLEGRLVALEAQVIPADRAEIRQVE